MKTNLPTEYNDIPEHTLMSLWWYEKTGQSVGGFLSAVLANDLQRAFGHADATHQACMRSIVRYVYNQMPSECWGSRDAVERWQEGRGAEGRGWEWHDGWTQPARVNA